MIEFFGAHHLVTKIGIAGRTGNFRRMQHHIGRATNRHRHDNGIADGFTGDDVAWFYVIADHIFQMTDQLVRKFGQTPFILRGGRHHMQRLHANNTDEGLHGVIGKHAATAAKSRTGLKRDAPFHVVVITAGQLVAGDNVNRIAGGRIRARTD